MENDEVGQRVAVYWPQEDHWFEGVVTSFERDKGYRVEYDDGDEEYLHSLDASHIRKLGSQHDGLGPGELRAFDEDSPVRRHHEDRFEASQEEMGVSLDNFSPLPVPRVEELHRLVEKHQPYARAAAAQRSIDDVRGNGRSNYFSTEEEEEGLRPDMGAEAEEDEDEQAGFHEPGPGEGEDEVALLAGEVSRATGLAGGGGACYFARVLYTESSGANVMFACKTTVHQTEAAACSGGGPGEVSWEQGEFRFELLAPAPGEPIVGELIFAVFEEAHGESSSGTISFVGQAIIDLASATTAAGSPLEKRVEGAFPLRTRKGTPLPGSAQLHLRLHVRLPLATRPPRAPPERQTASSSSKPPRTAPHGKRPPTRGTTGTGGGTARRTSSRPPSSQGGPPRKGNHAFVREREQDRIAKANRLHLEKLAKYKKAQPAGPRASSKQRLTSEAEALGLTVDIPGQRQDAGNNSKAAPAARMLVVQQEVAALRDRLKLLGARLGRAEAASRRNNIKGAKSSTPSADENREPNRSSSSSIAVASRQATAAAGEAALLLCVSNFSEEALDELEQRGSVQVGVYRDLMARRRAWTSRVETFQGEWRRSDEAVKALQERVEEAERARRGALSSNSSKGGGGSAPSGEEDGMLDLQARAQDLRVEVEALKTARKLKLANGDLEHEMRVLQGSLEQSRDMAAEKRERLRAVLFDRDSYRDKYEAMAAGQLRDKLTASVNALQLALVVLSKEKDWGQVVSEGLVVEAEAAARTAVAAERRALVTAETLRTLRNNQMQHGI